MTHEKVQWGNVVTARHLRNYQVQVILDTAIEEKRRGPWSIIVDESPASGGEGIGPSPVNVAMAALAA